MMKTLERLAPSLAKKVSLVADWVEAHTELKRAMDAGPVQLQDHLQARCQEITERLLQHGRDSMVSMIGDPNVTKLLEERRLHRRTQAQIARRRATAAREYRRMMELYGLAK